MGLGQFSQLNSLLQQVGNGNGSQYGALAMNGLGVVGNWSSNSEEVNVNNVVNLVTSIFDLIGSQEATKAGQECQKAEQTSQKTQTEISEIKSQTQTETDRIQEQFEKSTQQLQEAYEKVLEAKKQMQENTDKVSDIMSQIEEQKKVLENATTDGEKSEALLKIGSLSSEMSGLLTSIGDLQAVAEEQNTIVEEQQVIADDTQQKAADIQAKSQLSIQEQVTNLTTQVQNTTNTGVKAAQNQIQSVQLEVAADASSNVFTMSESVKLRMAAQDQQQAATTRTSSVQSVMTTIQKGLGGLVSITDNLTNFDNAIGSVRTNFDNVIGNLNTELKPFINSCGSYQEVEEANNQLIEAVNTEISKLPSPLQQTFEKFEQTNVFTGYKKQASNTENTTDWKDLFKLPEQNEENNNEDKSSITVQAIDNMSEIAEKFKSGFNVK